MFQTRLFVLPVIAVVLGACTPLEPAPTDLNELLHFFLQHYSEGDDALIGEASVNTINWFDEQLEGEETAGSVSVLSKDEVSALGLSADTDLSNLIGVFHFVEQQCSVTELEELYFFEDQMILFPDNYEDYARTYGDSRECFADGSCNLVDWMLHINDSLLGQSMVYDLSSGLRRVVGQQDAQGNELSILLSRTWMPEPAIIGQGEGAAFFDQSYQIELFVSPVGQSTSLHLYGLWNSGGLDGLSSDPAFWENQYLDGIVEWDERLDLLCAMKDPFNPE